MHEAYELSHLLTMTMQIECMAAYDNNLLIGTRQGQLLMYSLSLNKTSNKYEAQLLQYAKNFSKKPIQQIEVIPEDKLLLCLTDNQVGTYDMRSQNFPLVKLFPQTKGASLFALDNKSTISMTGESNSVVRLCVAVRRKLQLYYGKNGEFKQHLIDFTVNDIPRVIAWGQEYLCVGFKAEYMFYDLSSGTAKELFPVGSAGEPTLTKHSDGAFLLGRDDGTLLLREGRDVQIEHALRWRCAPTAIVWDEPYLVALLQDELAVQTVDTQLFIQTLPELMKARLMYRCKRGMILVASTRQVWCAAAADVARQRRRLLQDKHFALAAHLTNLSDEPEEDKKQKIHYIQMLHAMDLFESKQYSESMSEFIKLNTDAAEVIKLFPELDNTPDGEQQGTRTGRDLEDALNALIHYLTQLRSKLRKDTVQDDEALQRNVAQQLELIDTTLLKCYLQTNDALIAPLLRLNNCRLEEAERTLLQHGKHSELIILYQTKARHVQALQLLAAQAASPDSSLRGHHRTKQYLQSLGSEHLNLIFKFSDWILKDHPEEGLKIFTEDKAEVESLPRPRVLDFLLREHGNLVIPYLEHVIHTWNDTNPLFHDALITKYREKITDKSANITEEEMRHTKGKLVAFLEQSNCYVPERMILHFPNDSLFEERAVILGKLGRHEQALSIYVQILGDVERAIRYCENVSEKSKDAQDVFVILMRVLLNPEQLSLLTGPLANISTSTGITEPDIDTALSILEKHGDKISPLKALAVLPDSVPLARLKTFLESALATQVALRRRTQILKGLLYAEHLQVQEQKRYHESKSVVINDYNVCPVCKKRFGNQSAFVRYPNGDIVHYSCRLDK